MTEKLEKYLNESSVTKRDLEKINKHFKQFHNMIDDLYLNIVKSGGGPGEFKEAKNIIRNIGKNIDEIDKRLENLTIDKIKDRR